MISYRLFNGLLSDPVHIEITEVEFSAIWGAMKALHAHLLIEERFRILIDNYRCIELELLTQTLDVVIFGTDEWSPTMGKLHALNRHLLNLLASARMYVDHMDQVGRGAERDGHSPTAEATKRAKARSKQQSSASLAYRAMMALRNHAQHRELPITGIGWKRARASAGGPAEVTAIVGIDLRRLREDERFDAGVLADLEALPKDEERVALMPLVRQYVAGLQDVHIALQDAVDDHIAKWRAVVDVALSRIEPGADGRTSVAYAASSDDVSNRLERVTLMRETQDRLDSLRRQNRAVGRLLNAKITSG